MEWCTPMLRRNLTCYERDLENISLGSRAVAKQPGIWVRDRFGFPPEEAAVGFSWVFLRRQGNPWDWWKDNGMSIQPLWRSPQGPALSDLQSLEAAWSWAPNMSGRRHGAWDHPGGICRYLKILVSLGWLHRSWSPKVFHPCTFFTLFPGLSINIHSYLPRFHGISTSSASPKSFQVSEACVFRATTHHSDGVDIHLKLTVQGGEDLDFERFLGLGSFINFIMDVSWFIHLSV